MRTFISILCLVVAGGDQFAKAQGYAPAEAAGKMKVAEGLRVRLVASEPEVRDPILVKCDDRGRLWTIQYLQYPNPAGLKRAKVDRWSRTVYDRVPEPPPRGPRGADRITILEDTDGDGRADKFHDFIDGLNLVTGLEFGHGGVFVLQVPYLLFYPDGNRDDVPDADPEVLLTGFGMEDAQSLANHLTFGPDGWLYGVNGSTTTCNIRGIEFQQGLWRYHPITRAFELFCEGGSNTFGVTFDERGDGFYSTNGGPLVHAVQGGYFYKSFGKHGPVHNPYAYHFFPQLTCDEIPGGPPTGGTIYLGDSFPPQYRGKFIAGNFLGHTASWWHIEPAGTTVRARYGGLLLDSKDTWFGATDMCLAPDGSMYVCDFCDRRTAHPDPDAKWDHSNGRIYKIEAVGVKPIGAFDLAKLGSAQLVDLLSHSNGWFVQRARTELAYRRDASVVPRLRTMALDKGDERLALEGLWALHASAGLDDATAEKLLAHPFEYVRAWTVRLVGDRHKASPAVHAKLLELADHDASPIVRLQLAASAKRLPGAQGLPIVERLLSRDLDEGDERITWTLWWAIENKAIIDSEPLLKFFANPTAWDNPAKRDNIKRLVRRYAAEGSRASYGWCLRLLEATPSDQLSSMHEHLGLGLAERSRTLPGVGQGGLFEQAAVVSADATLPNGRTFEPVTQELKRYIAQLWKQEPRDLLSTELALRAEVEDAYAGLKASATDADTSGVNRLAALSLLREFGRDDIIEPMLSLVASDKPDSEKLPALDVLSRFESKSAASALLKTYPRMSTPVRSKIRDVLLYRASSAKVLLEIVDRGELPATEVPIEQLRGIGLFGDNSLDALVRKHWGNVGPGTPEEKLATMRRYNNDLRAGSGDAAHGKELFTKHCAVCHTLHGEGNKVGPDLTTANRKDRAALLANLVDPSAVIRHEYLNYVVQTGSGQILTGLLAEQDAGGITILDAKNQRVKLPRDQVESIDESSVSLMPENLLDSLSPQELRDLFGYLEK